MKLKDMEALIEELKSLLSKAEQHRSSVNKRVDAGVVHETHLAHADGVVDGLQSALTTVEVHQHQ